MWGLSVRSHLINQLKHFLFVQISAIPYGLFIIATQASSHKYMFYEDVFVYKLRISIANCLISRRIATRNQGYGVHNVRPLHIFAQVTDDDVKKTWLTGLHVLFAVLYRIVLLKCIYISLHIHI